MPTTQNPTPLPPVPGPTDPVQGSGQFGGDPYPSDIYGDKDFDDDDAEEAMKDLDLDFTDDGTGLHPTPTKYMTTTVAVSHKYGPAQATPTSDTYHVSGIPPANILAFNKRIGAGSNGFLRFRVTPLEDPQWGNYSPWMDYHNLVYPPGYAPNQPMWLDGMTLQDSWDYHSPITNQVYKTVAPTVVFVDVNTKRAVYYFFDVIFNDFQAAHGFANWDYSKDGWPSSYWPGMIQVVRSVIKSSQVPSNRDDYEVYMTKHYGTPLAVAPFVQSSALIATGQAIPTRYRQAATPTGLVSRDVPPENPVIQLDTSGESTDSGSGVEQATVNAQIQAAVSAALASAAISQQQALDAYAAQAAADKAQALAAQQQLLTAQLNAAVASAIAAGNLSQQQAVAAQAAADQAAQSAALSAQASQDAAALQQAVANAVAAQAAKDATQQAAAVAAQKAADASAQQAAVNAQLLADSQAQQVAVANAIATQAARDQKLYTMPVFTTALGVGIGSKYTGTAFTINSSFSGMDYSHVWLKAFTGFADYARTNGQSFTSQSAAQASSGGILLNDTNSSTNPWWSYTAITQFGQTGSNISIYSGWLRAGTPTQIVGWVVSAVASGSSTLQTTLITTGYGFTSLSPTARSGMSNSTTYNLTSNNIQAEILANITLNGINYVGFIYDASIGSYGQVTWISQI